MNEPISWGQLIIIVAFLLGTALVLYLVMAVANLVGILRKVRQMLGDISDPLKKTMDQLPTITENAAKITGQVHDSMDDIQKVMVNVGKITESAKGTVDTIRNDVVVKVKSLLGTADGVRKFFVKKDASRKTKSDSSVYRYTYSKDQSNPASVEVEKSADETEDASISPDHLQYEKQETDSGNTST